jgi:hypothetical protein
MKDNVWFPEREFKVKKICHAPSDPSSFTGVAALRD